MKELDELDGRYGRPRRTQVADASVSDVATREDLIPDAKSLIIFSEGGYIKRVCDTTFETQVRMLSCIHTSSGHTCCAAA